MRWTRILRLLMTDPLGGVAAAILLGALIFVGWLMLDPTEPYTETASPMVTNDHGAPVPMQNGAYRIAAGDTVVITRSYCLKRDVEIELQRVFSTGTGLRHFVPEARLDSPGHAECGQLRALLPIPIYLPQARWTELVWVVASPNPLRHVRYQITPLLFDIQPAKWEKASEQLRGVLGQIQRRLDQHEAHDREETLHRKVLATQIKDLQRQLDQLTAHSTRRSLSGAPRGPE